MFFLTANLTSLQYLSLVSPGVCEVLEKVLLGMYLSTSSKYLLTFFGIIKQVIAGEQGIPINVTELSDYAVVVALVVEVFSCCGCSNIFIAAHSEVEDAVVAESQWCLTSQVLDFFFMSGEQQIQDVWSLVTATTSGYLDVLNQKVILHILLQ